MAAIKVKIDDQWVKLPGYGQPPMEDAPIDNESYVRKNGDWDNVKNSIIEQIDATRPRITEEIIELRDAMPLATALANGKMAAEDKAEIRKIGMDLYGHTAPMEGVYIQTIYNEYVSPDDWDDTRVANGIFVGDGTHRFIVALRDTFTDCFELSPYADLRSLDCEKADVNSTAYQCFNGVDNTRIILNAVKETNPNSPVLLAEGQKFPNGETGYIGATGEWLVLYLHFSDINEALTICGGEPVAKWVDYWTSTVYNGSMQGDYHWVFNTNGFANTILKSKEGKLRLFQQVIDSDPTVGGGSKPERISINPIILDVFGEDQPLSGEYDATDRVIDIFKSAVENNVTCFEYTGANIPCLGSAMYVNNDTNLISLSVKVETYDSDESINVFLRFSFILNVSNRKVAADVQYYTLKNTGYGDKFLSDNGLYMDPTSTFYTKTEIDTMYSGVNTILEEILS